MDTNVKKRWVKALRSGKYKQTNSWLTDEGSHCCLGVLCEIYGTEELGMSKQEVRRDMVLFSSEDDIDEVPNDCGEMPAAQILEWANLPYKLANDLATMNDEGSTFAQIADHIEREL